MRTKTRRFFIRLWIIITLLEVDWLILLTLPSLNKRILLFPSFSIGVSHIKQQLRQCWHVGSGGSEVCHWQIWALIFASFAHRSIRTNVIMRRLVAGARPWMCVCVILPAPPPTLVTEMWWKQSWTIEPILYDFLFQWHCENLSHVLNGDGLFAHCISIH